MLSTESRVLLCYLLRVECFIDSSVTDSLVECFILLTA